MFGGLNDDPTKNVRFTADDNDTRLLDEYDKKMLLYLNNLYTAMTGDVMDIDNVENAVDALKIFNEKRNCYYLDTLLNPEMTKGAKIPASIPVPSAAFQMHNTVTLATNSSGNLAFMFNPYMLYNKDDKFHYAVSQQETYDSEWLSTLWANNSENLTGSSPNENWIPVNIGQGIPPVYGSYRVVSASVVVKYIGRMDIASGVAGGAIIFDDNPCVGAQYLKKVEDGEGHVLEEHKYTLNRGLAKYGNFDLAMDAFYHQENLALQGIREIYFPLDNSYEEYIETMKASKSQHSWVMQGISTEIETTYDKDLYKSGFNYFFYVLGAPANSSCFKVDIYVNYECLPDSNFLNYMPISPAAPAISPMEKSGYIKYVQQQPITASSDENGRITTKKPESIWAKWRKKFGKAMPSVISMAKKGLFASLPYLKPMITLAGNYLAGEDVSMTP